jgi:DNA repair exonuclease SbcCD ATPase subunit
MKLAEALIERSDLQKRTGELRARIADALYKSEDEEVENIQELLEKVNAVSERLEGLIRSINRTNMLTEFHAEGVDGVLSDALARRDSLSAKHKTLSEALTSASSSGRRLRYYDDRPAGKLTIAVSDLRREADDLSGMIRRLDLAIQQVNWNTDLL